MTEASSDNPKWEGDLFDRKHYADFLTQTLLKSGQPTFVLNIDSSWGSGKSFFLQHWYEDIKKNHPAIFFDAWKTDYSKNPFISISSCFLEGLTQHLPDTEKKAAKKNMYKKVGGIVSHTLPAITKSLIKNYVGEGGLEALQDIGSDTEEGLATSAESMAKLFIEGHNKTQANIIDFKDVIKENLDDIQEKTNFTSPLFVFIDELDRCRPDYAIELLETIKHLFDIEDVIFILATDTVQLASAVKSIYGESFSAEVYLKRFFNQSYTLPDPSVEQFTDFIFSKLNFSEGNPPKLKFLIDNPIEEVKELIKIVSFNFSLSLRDQEQCFFRLQTLINSFPSDEQIHIFFLYYLIVLHHKHGNSFEEFIGKVPTHQTPLNFDRFGEKLTLDVLASTYRTFYCADQEIITSNSHQSSGNIVTYHNRLANIILTQSMQTTVFKNVLLKYPGKVSLAGAIH